MVSNKRMQIGWTTILMLITSWIAFLVINLSKERCFLSIRNLLDETWSLPILFLFGLELKATSCRMDELPPPPSIKYIKTKNRQKAILDKIGKIESKHILIIRLWKAPNAKTQSKHGHNLSINRSKLLQRTQESIRRDYQTQFLSGEAKNPRDFPVIAQILLRLQAEITPKLQTLLKSY